MNASVADADWIRRRLWPTLAVCLLLVVFEAGLAPEGVAVLASNVLQLGLAAAAAIACFRAAARERGLPRWFFALTGAGMALWATAQAILTLTGSATPPRALVAVQDLLFVSSTAPLVAACALRPHRPRPGALGLAADVGLVCVLGLFLHAYFGSAGQLLGGPDPSPENLVFFSPPERLMLLLGMLWLRRGSEGRWRRLYDQLALAMVGLLAGGILPNLVLYDGSYRPGLFDLAWTLPFLWVAHGASEWRPAAADTGRDPLAEQAAGLQASVWAEARRGNVLALGAVVLVPAVHQVATLLSSPAEDLASVRSQIALAGTLLLGALYLARQLHMLRRAEGTQRAREARFRALVEHSADAIGVLDARGRLSYVSASSERVTGYRPDQLVGRSPFELLHQDELDALQQALRDVVSRPGASARGFIRYRHQDGSFRHGAIDAVNPEARAIGGVVLYLRDVTEGRRAEQERERSLSLLEATLEATADGLLVVDRAGRITRLNRKLAALWRFPYEELAAQQYDVVATSPAGGPASGDDERTLAHILDQPEAPGAFLEKVRELHAQPEAESFDTLHFRDGRVFERYSLPQRLAGEVVGRVWSFRDVTERARAERSTARLVAILEATPDFVGTSDASGRALFVNRAGRRMLGIADDEPLEGRHIAAFHPAGAAARVLEEAIPRALAEGYWSGESRLRHATGAEIPVLQVVLAHRSAGGEVDFLSTIARDIRERTKAEQDLRRSQTMAALGSLVAGVAHEVRGPLFAIRSTLEAFGARSRATDDHAPYVRVLREQLERLTQLMSDLLEYAEPSRLELRQGRVEEVVAQALGACAALRERTAVTIETRLASGLPPLEMDERRLGQVFRNLIENALQLSPKGGHVRLETRLVEREGAAWVECSVEDDGPGFQAEDLPHLFEPFFTRRHGGTGLGLSIAQRIVSDHGGSIRASNREPGGARLTLWLPGAPLSDGAS